MPAHDPAWASPRLGWLVGGGGRRLRPELRQPTQRKAAMSIFRAIWGALILSCTATTMASAPASAQQGQKPNILFIMGDDIGLYQPSIYHRGLMVGETPNIDRIGNEGALFTHYYAEQSCTAGRNAFFT